MNLSKLAPISDHLARFEHLEALGIRFKGAYVFEEPFFVSWMFYFIRPLLSEKIRSRLFMCGRDYSHLTGAVSDVSMLPVVFGGQLEMENSLASEWIRDQCRLLYGLDM